MPYEDILKRAEGHMTKKYDEQFEEAKAQGLSWYPWVGKEYNKSGILILGMSTYYIEGEKDWSPTWRNYGETDVGPSRVLITEHAIEQDINKGCFANTAMMFLEGVDKGHNENTRKMFWRAVAFTNFIQQVVASGTQVSDVDRTVLRNSRNALQAIIKILKPKMVLVWGVTTVDGGIDNLNRKGEEKVSAVYPRIIDDEFPIIGIEHPSKYFGRGEWLEFLRTDPASKQPVEDFLQYLKQQPSN